MPTNRHYHNRVRRLHDFRQERFINSLNIGAFTGRFYLSWSGPNHFMYHPDAADPFTYHRKDANGAVVEQITPKAMTTDGASIPRLVWPIPGFSPWDYGPAHIIHDWEFQAHDDGLTDKSFEEVNLTFAEAMLTLMRVGYLETAKPRENLDALYTIFSFVNSSLGRKVWDDNDNAD